MAFLKSVLYFAILGIGAHFIGEALPRHWFHHDRFPYRTWGWEKNGLIYKKLRIDAWKDRVPDMSRIMKKMVPKRVGKCPKAADVWRLVQETCVAEIVHLALCITAPVIYFFWWNGWGVLCASLVIVGNIPFIFIQRYNRPTLVSLARRLEAREERKRNACADPVGEYGWRT